MQLPRTPRPCAWVAIAACALTLFSCREPHSPPPPPPFVEVAAASGIDFVHENGATGKFYFPEQMGAGAAFVDVDNDSFLDIYLIQSGPLSPTSSPEPATNALYRNRGDGSFEPITESAGVGDDGYGSGIAAADFDGDGWVDLYVTNFGRNTLYRNRGTDADGRVGFDDVTETTGVGDPGYSTSAAFVDYDADGDLDLFVCNYVDWSFEIERPCLGSSGLPGYCNPMAYQRPQADTLYRNDGAGPEGEVRFTDVSTASGIATVEATGLGIVTADFDGDGWVDIYVANDAMANHLWRNNGDGTFSEEALIRGAAFNATGQPEGSMGITTEDVDVDGDWDLFMTHLSGETNTFYRNAGGSFRDVTDALDLGSVSHAYTGFGTGLFDHDNDGVLDLFIANGKVQTRHLQDHPIRAADGSLRYDYSEPNQLFRGQLDGRFEDVSAMAGDAFAQTEVSRGAAFGDYDNDGDVDILVANNGGPVRLLRNEVGGENHFLSVETVGRNDRDSLGAVVELHRNGRIVRRQVQPAYSYCSSNDPRLHFGLGELAEVERLTVVWPDGTSQDLLNVAADQFLELVEPPLDREEAKTGEGL